MHALDIFDEDWVGEEIFAATENEVADTAFVLMPTIQAANALEAKAMLHDILNLTDRPVLMAAVEACVVHEQDKGSWRIAYPRRGAPGPYSDKICHHKDPQTGLVCGIGGHTERRHRTVAALPLPEQAQMHVSWLKEHADALSHLERAHQCFQMLVLLLALVAYEDPDGCFDNILGLYQIVVHEVALQFPASVRIITPEEAMQAQMLATTSAEKRNFRIGSQSLAAAIKTVIAEAPCALYDRGVDASHAIYTLRATFDRFPSVPGSLEDSWEEQDAALLAWANRGFPLMEKDKATTSFLVPLMISRPKYNLSKTPASCTDCGLMGHNNRSCRGRSAAYKLASCIVALVTIQKHGRIRPSTRLRTLFYCYYGIYALLYQGWVNGGVKGMHEACSFWPIEPSPSQPAHLLMRLWEWAAQMMRGLDGDRALLELRPWRGIGLIPAASIFTGR